MKPFTQLDFIKMRYDSQRRIASMELTPILNEASSEYCSLLLKHRKGTSLRQINLEKLSKLFGDMDKAR
jgi:hypothetical protein